jgi:hypothetical protein
MHRNVMFNTAALSYTLILFASGCSRDSHAGNEERDAATRDVGESKSELRCVADVIEPDLDIGPMGGSSVDEETGLYKLKEGQEVVVSSTYGIPKPAAIGGGLPPHYQDLMGRIIQQLQGQPGLLALQLGTSSSCNSGRTLAVWESEELMYKFVMSAPHLEAMSSANELLKPGYAVTHWSARNQDEISLDAAVDHLAEKLERK